MGCTNSLRFFTKGQGFYHARKREKVMAYELGDIDRRSQMRVANILTCLNWKKLGQKQHQGKRQVVWIPATQRGNNEDVAENEKQQTGSQQGFSAPTIPTTPNSNNISGEVKPEVIEQDNEKLENQVQENRKVSPSPSSQDIQPTTPPEKSPATPINWQSYPYNSQDT